MSNEEDNETVLGLAFELQRDTIKLGQKTIERTLDARRELDDRLVRGLRRQGQTQDSALEFTQETIDDLLDAVGRTAGAEERVEEIRENVADGFADIRERQGNLIEDLSERYDPETREVDPLDQAFLTALDDQLEFLLEANESIETQTVDAVENIVDELEDLVDVITEESGGVGKEFQTQFDRFGEELEGQFDEFEQRFEDRMDRIDRLRDRVEDLQDEVEIEVEDATTDTEAEPDEA